MPMLRIQPSKARSSFSSRVKFYSNGRTAMTILSYWSASERYGSKYIKRKAEALIRLFPRSLSANICQPYCKYAYSYSTGRGANLKMPSITVAGESPKTEKSVGLV